MQTNCKYTWLHNYYLVYNLVAGADHQFDKEGIQLAIWEVCHKDTKPRRTQKKGR